MRLSLHTVLCSLCGWTLVDTSKSVSSWGSLGDMLDATYACEKMLAERCSNINSFLEPQGSCHLQDPPSFTSLFDFPVTDTAGISRSLRFGRLVWCLTQHTPIQTGLELFMGSGSGSTLLLAHGLTANNQRRFVSIEQFLPHVLNAKTFLTAAGLTARELQIPNGVQPNEVRDVLGAALIEPGSLLLNANILQHRNLLSELCSVLNGIDLLMLDPPMMDQALKEAFWRFFQSDCIPRFIAVHNTNLLDHAGWLVNQLLAEPGSAWREIAQGWHPSLWDDSHLLRSNATGRRYWSILARAYR